MKAKGATTCVMAELEAHPADADSVSLKTCNLGDSGYLLLRPDEQQSSSVIFKSESQQHYFNCPFQVGGHSKLPTKQFENEHKLKNDDIIVMGTDGVWDNLFDKDIQYCAASQLRAGSTSLDNIQHVSDCISTLAEVRGYDSTYESPFTVEGRKHGKEKVGGKEDDVTVIVSQVKVI